MKKSLLLAGMPFLTFAQFHATAPPGGGGSVTNAVTASATLPVNAIPMSNGSRGLLVSPCKYTVASGFTCGDATNAGRFGITTPGGATITLSTSATTGTGVWNLRAATDQVVGAGTTDIFQNKTFDTSSNIFQIGGRTLGSPSGPSLCLQSDATNSAVVWGSCDSAAILPSGSGNQIIATPADGSAGPAALRLLTPADLPGSAEVALSCTAGESASVTLDGGPKVFSTTCSVPAGRVKAGTVIRVQVAWQVSTATCTTAPGVQMVVQWVVGAATNIWVSPNASDASQALSTGQNARGGFGYFLFTGTAAPGASVPVQSGGWMALKGVADGLSSLGAGSPVSLNTQTAATLRFVVNSTSTANPAGCATLVMKQLTATVMN